MPGISRAIAAPLLERLKSVVSISEKEEEILCANINHRKYRKGQYLVQQGDTCKYIFYILTGCTKTYHIDQEGQEHIFQFSVEDWWTSDLGSLISQAPADFNVQCIENTEVLVFPYTQLETLYEEIPQLERFFRIIVERAYVSSQKRLIRNFSLTAKERYLYFKESYPHIEQRIPQYMVASYLGITKEFLSKIKSQLIFEQ